MIRRLFWLAVLAGGYFWISTSGKDHVLVRQAKALYESISEWIQDADADFQLKKSSKRKAQRWN